MIALRTVVLWLISAVAIAAEPRMPAGAERPEWLRRDGIVMAGGWEPLLFRVRRDGGDGYTPTPEQLAAYQREHSSEMIAQLKSLGVNFVMMHCYKGGGLQAERESMRDAVRFAQLCHDAGMRVGVYNYSGAFIWELFFQEKPEAKEWVVRGPDGSPVPYGKATYRYYWNRNHPGAEEFYKGLVRFSVEEIKTDLVHFDNYRTGRSWEAAGVRGGLLGRELGADVRRRQASQPHPHLQGGPPHEQRGVQLYHDTSGSGRVDGIQSRLSGGDLLV